MKIQLVSDTHNNTSELIINPDVDLVLHAGDISNSIEDLNLQTRIFDLLCKEAGVDYLLTLGNHDFYSNGYARPYTDAYNEVYDNTKLLTRHTGPKVINNITFVGCPLWTGSSLDFLEYYINDFKYIYREDYKCISLKEMNEWFAQDLTYIESFRDSPNTFILTHFAPSEILCDEKFQGNLLNPYFLNNINLKGFKHWACGHTHHTVIKQQDDCNLYLNAFGYKTKSYTECINFNSNFIIEI